MQRFRYPEIRKQWDWLHYTCITYYIYSISAVCVLVFIFATILMTFSPQPVMQAGCPCFCAFLPDVFRLAASTLLTTQFSLFGFHHVMIIGTTVTKPWRSLHWSYILFVLWRHCFDFCQILCLIAVSDVKFSATISVNNFFAALAL